MTIHDDELVLRLEGQLAVYAKLLTFALMLPPLAPEELRRTLAMLENEVAGDDHGLGLAGATGVQDALATVRSHLEQLEDAKGDRS